MMTNRRSKRPSIHSRTEANVTIRSSLRRLTSARVCSLPMMAVLPLAMPMASCPSAVFMCRS